MTSLRSIALALRRWFSPNGRDHGWMPLAYLGYLLFLFVPLLMRLLPGRMAIPIPFRMDATLASIVLFLPLYATVWRSAVKTQVVAVIGIFALGLLLFPFNPYSNTYVIYAASLSAVLALPLRTRVLMLVAMLAVFIMSMWLLGVPPNLVLFVAIVTVVIGVAAFSANHFQVERERKRGELKLSQDEVRRIAAFAERERIGRDLHDLLGHTLSLIALKADLARKLVAVDPKQATDEIADLARVTRQTLAEVREAVSGMRNAAIAAEAACMQSLLERSNIRLHFDVKDIPMAESSQQALAMALREAATNIHRHSGATQAWITLDRHGDRVQLEVRDNGSGGDYRAGNGLQGMSQRLRAIGGGMEIGVAPPGKGTRLRAWAPLSAGTTLP